MSRPDTPRYGEKPTTYVRRSMHVPPGKVVREGYVPVWDIELLCRDRMAVGDVGAAFDRLLQVAPNQEHPPPFGYWKDGSFIIVDGRHAFVALLMLGYTHILVAWMEEDSNV